jgi:hypothetical protein
MKTSRKQAGQFRVGDWVSFRYGPRSVVAQVVETRGPLGVNQRPLYRIQLSREASEPDSFEMPEDELNAAAPPDREAVVQYLTEGGLVAILRSNLAGGRNPPRVWLTFTPQGEVTHTLTAELGVIGGETVPFFALQENRVFTAKKDEVIGFLTSFGLTRNDAVAVVAAVGTAP